MGAAPDEGRRHLGFLTAAGTAALADRGVAVLDPGSTLVSPGIDWGRGVVLYPGTVVQRLDGAVAVGAGTVLFPGTRIVAAGGSVLVEEAAEIGEEGGFTLKAEEAGIRIRVGAGARLLGGGSLARSNEIGRGAQVLGPIRCQDCVLGDGGTHREPDPDRRGGVLKGTGVARGITVPAGHVIQAFGLFAEAPLRRQIEFHPPPAGRAGEYPGD
ncbi:hypothetical protein [Arenibaculum pallidiluteum]|uniref:hypothetical protein n=1 Tax=Arenibaculum pallidiluteum TaxID=2812559 RepID=UPI001A95E2BE|nr:hypothetical protein [Arenibaculum pallidiluteum]